MSRQYRIRGMDCAEEIAILKREIGPLVGGEGNLSFDLLKARMTVAAPVDEREIVTAVERTGMRAQVWKEGSEEAEPAGIHKPSTRRAGPGGQRLPGRPVGKFPAVAEYLCTLRRPGFAMGTEDPLEQRLILHLLGRAMGAANVLPEIVSTKSGRPLTLTRSRCHSPLGSEGRGGACGSRCLRRAMGWAAVGGAAVLFEQKLHRGEIGSAALESLGQSGIEWLGAIELEQAGQTGDQRAGATMVVEGGIKEAFRFGHGQAQRRADG